MKVLGSKLKALRKSRRMSQLELSKGICTKATISNVENKDICSLEIITQICNRLNVSIEDYVIKSSDIERTVQEAEKLCKEGKQKCAYTLFKGCTYDATIEAPVVQAKYYYYKGIAGIAAGDTGTNILFNLFKAINTFREPKIYTILSWAALGSYYASQSDLKKANLYFDKALNYTDEFSKKFSKEIGQIYMESAKFYAQEGQYKKSIELCEKGIHLCVKKGESYNLDRLLYLKAKNRRAVHLYALDDYKSAYYVNMFYGNKKAAERIESELNSLDYNL
ncbi:hypothetical protein IGJ21_002621 [Enterococcus sp. DIV2416]|uniref:helix-turn-helix domain-containing protein n=1 Tax=unclassified Enterococcus TaxID=2608891 RepID=UPI003F229E49